MKAAIIGVIAVIVLGVGGFFLFRGNSTPTTPTTTTPSTSSDSSSSSTENTTDKQVAATITYTGGGFSPSSITVKSGDIVAIKNSSSNALQFDSDPHPTHTDDPDLNVGSVETGQTVTFTVTKKGTFGYHNHFSPNDKGTITVQ